MQNFAHINFQFMNSDRTFNSRSCALYFTVLLAKAEGIWKRFEADVCSQTDSGIHLNHIRRHEWNTNKTLITKCANELLIRRKTTCSLFIIENAEQDGSFFRRNLNFSSTNEFHKWKLNYCSSSKRFSNQFVNATYSNYTCFYTDTLGSR